MHSHEDLSSRCQHHGAGTEHSEKGRPGLFPCLHPAATSHGGSCGIWGRKCHTPVEMPAVSLQRGFGLLLEKAPWDQFFLGRRFSAWRRELQVESPRHSKLDVQRHQHLESFSSATAPGDTTGTRTAVSPELLLHVAKTAHRSLDLNAIQTSACGLGRARYLPEKYVTSRDTRARRQHRQHSPEAPICSSLFLRAMISNGNDFRWP